MPTPLRRAELPRRSLLTGGARAIPTDLRAFVTREVEVVLSDALTVQLREVHFQLRPDHWAHIWPCAVAMSRWLLEATPHDWPARARELGCGLGLVTLTLAHLGIAIEGTDREPIALAFARDNALRNAITGVTVRHLEWTAMHGAPTALMVASDVLYERDSELRLYELLQATGTLLPLGRVLLGGPVERSDQLQRLVERLCASGYVDEPAMRVVEWQGRTQVIAIHLLRSPD
ncbi:MAG: class I SAM-dependent methyltransferase [Polyangiales bacterium]